MRFPRPLRAFAAALLLVLLLDLCNGTFGSEFGRYQDEGMHYVTGLLIRDFIAAGSWAVWTHPMTFALDFYAHFPKVALGNWPPVFEILQALWGLLFGVSRPSMMVGMAVLTAALAAVMYRAAKFDTQSFAAVAAATALVAAPLTQAQTAMTMAEVPLALFSFLALLAWVRFLDSGGSGPGWQFGMWTTIAILTKGNGWVVALLIAVSIVVLWQWSVLRLRAFWSGTMLVALMCIPYTLITMRIVVQGWNQTSTPSLPELLTSLAVHHSYISGVLGWPLYLIACAGLADRVILPCVRREHPKRLWSILALYGIAVWIFHASVPTSFEPRKIYQIAPVLGMFLAAGLDVLARYLSVSGALLVAALGFGMIGFSLIEPFAPGFAPAVTAVMKDPRSLGTAILVSSNPLLEDAEAAIIAEWASRDRMSGSYLARGTKLLSSMVQVDSVTDFEPFDANAQALNARLADVPISFVILHTTQANHSYKHHSLLAETLATPDWQAVYRAQTSVDGRPHELQVFRNAKDVRGLPVHLEIDLSKKLGVPAAAGSNTN